jgi:hypothetical protein
MGKTRGDEAGEAKQAGLACQDELGIIRTGKSPYSIMKIDVFGSYLQSQAALPENARESQPPADRHFARDRRA